MSSGDAAEGDKSGSGPHRIGRIPISCVSLAGALEVIFERAARREGGVVVTPNIDHVVLAERDGEFRQAYDEACLSLVDGTPVLWTAKAMGYPVPEKISGSDLVWPLLQGAAQRNLSVYLLGGAEGAAEEARTRLARELPTLRIAGIDSPWIDLASPAGTDAPVLRRIAEANPDIVIVGFGAPKQEIWMHRNRGSFGGAVALGLGASIDFLAGRVRRAPGWVSKAGLEWIFRLVQEPRRLAHRYLVRDPEYVVIIGRQIARRSRGGQG